MLNIPLPATTVNVERLLAFDSRASGDECIAAWRCTIARENAQFLFHFFKLAINDHFVNY
jgi:hypothetical protein